MDRRERTEKYAAVQNWLQSVFGDEPIPSFHESDVFVDHLHDLMVQQKQVDSKSELYASSIATFIKDYTDDLACKSSILNRLGLSDSLSTPTAEVENLASIANSLSISSLNETAFVLALTDLTMEKDKTTAELETFNKSLVEGADDLTTAIKLNNQLEMLLTSAAQQRSALKSTSASISRETEFLQNKVAKYKSDQKKYEVKLSKSGVTRSLTHEKLMDDYSELERLTSKLENTREELAKFANLPPDKELALVKLEVAKSELAELETQLSRQIDMFHI